MKAAGIFSHPTLETIVFSSYHIHFHSGYAPSKVGTDEVDTRKMAQFQHSRVVSAGRKCAIALYVKHAILMTSLVLTA